MGIDRLADLALYGVCADAVPGTTAAGKGQKGAHYREGAEARSPATGSGAYGRGHRESHRRVHGKNHPSPNPAVRDGVRTEPPVYRAESPRPSGGPLRRDIPAQENCLSSARTTEQLRR